MTYSKDEIMKGLDRCYHLQRSYREEINDGSFDECFDCPFRPDGKDTCDTLEPLFEATIELLKAEEAKPLRCGGCSWFLQITMNRPQTYRTEKHSMTMNSA